jgi:hypothetical protein
MMGPRPTGGASFFGASFLVSVHRVGPFGHRRNVRPNFKHKRSQHQAKSTSANRLRARLNGEAESELPIALPADRRLAVPRVRNPENCREDFAALHAITLCEKRLQFRRFYAVNSNVMKWYSRSLSISRSMVRSHPGSPTSAGVRNRLR